MLNDEVICLHVEINMLVGASYLDIEDAYTGDADACELMQLVLFQNTKTFLQFNTFFFNG